MKLELTKEEAQEILWGGHENFEIVEDEIVDNRRWSIDHRIVIQRVSDKKFFADTYSVGATEMQDEGPWEYEEPDFREVFPVERTVVSYESKTDK